MNAGKTKAGDGVYASAKWKWYQKPNLCGLIHKKINKLIIWRNTTHNLKDDGMDISTQFTSNFSYAGMTKQ